MFKNFLDRETPIGELRRKLAYLTKLLSDYSYGDVNLPLDTMKVNAERTLSEIKEISQRCSQNDTMHFYDKFNTEIPVYLAVSASKYYIESVLDNNFKFTAPLMRHMNRRAEIEHRYNNGNATNGKPLASEIFWNFVFFMDEILAKDNIGLYRSIDTSNLLEYRCPIVTERIVKGYIIFSVEGEYEETHLVSRFQLIGNIISNTDQIIHLGKWPLMGNIDVEQCQRYVNNLMETVEDDERMLLISLKGSF